jgi:DNA invertase Pin-like site-specific DNA recombinase
MTHFMGSSFMPALDFFNDSERENTGRPLFADIVELKAKKIEKGSRSFHIYEFDLVNVLDPENDKDKLERLKTMYTKGKDYVKKQQALAYSLSERILHQSNTEIDSMIQEDESDFVDGEITTEDLQEKDEEDDDEPNVSMEDLPF